jgi:hypothetical protein
MESKQAVEFSLRLVELRQAEVGFDEKSSRPDVGGIEAERLLTLSKRRRPSAEPGIGFGQEVVEFVAPGVNLDSTLQIRDGVPRPPLLQGQEGGPLEGNLPAGRLVQDLVESKRRPGKVTDGPQGMGPGILCRHIARVGMHGRF